MGARINDHLISVHRQRPVAINSGTTEQVPAISGQPSDFKMIVEATQYAIRFRSPLRPQALLRRTGIGWRTASVTPTRTRWLIYRSTTLTFLPTRH